VVHIVEDSRGTREALLSDRRRPDRRNFKNPHLVALLRGQHGGDPSATETQVSPIVQPDVVVEPERNGLIAARGIAYSLLFGSVLWALMVFVWRMV
jgi:hypothetical protein